ncbi:hypothetical protein [Paenibacillus lautus]|uniref:hypothetical protein n=1 Tax=Paenibacillus lautus TaxID=1401 RepID=UPI003D28ED30
MLTLPPLNDPVIFPEILPAYRLVEHSAAVCSRIVKNCATVHSERIGSTEHIHTTAISVVCAGCIAGDFTIVHHTNSVAVHVYAAAVISHTVRNQNIPHAYRTYGCIAANRKASAVARDAQIRFLRN